MHIHDLFEEKARKGDGQFAIAYALMNLVDAHKSVATHLKYLGNGDAATTMGAIEAFGAHIGEKLEGLTSAISEIGIAINEFTINENEVEE